MAYDPKLRGCFGDNGEFAVQPPDHARAFEWLVDLRERRVTWIEAREQIREYLRERGASDEYTDEQIERAQRMLWPWLLGPTAAVDSTK